jgi:hypothetical protein
MRRFGLVLVATGTLMAVGVPAAAASGVSIKAKPATMVYGVGGTISGGLTTPGAATKFVLLQSTYPYGNANLKQIAEQSNSDTALGKYSFKIKPTATARYRVDAKGPLPASSDPVKVFVKRRILFRARRLSPSQVRFTGFLLPNETYWIYLQHRYYGNKRFRNFLRLRASQGPFAAVFAKTVVASALQDWRIRVFESPDDVRGFVTATSQVITL